MGLVSELQHQIGYDGDEVGISAALTQTVYRATGVKDLKRLSHLSHFLDEKLNRFPNIQAPYVGAGAFSHKGGLHVSAVAKDVNSYEHVKPEAVGNSRFILVSDQAGKSNFINRLKALKVKFRDDDKLKQFMAEIKLRENEGYSYDGADGSFELLARRKFENAPEYFTLTNFRVLTERRIRTITLTYHHHFFAVQHQLYSCL